MLSLQTILPNTLELLKTLSAREEMQQMRLVGGTALALQYGHRQSVDLDFFGKMPSDQETIADMLDELGTYTTLNRSSHIWQIVVNSIKVDFVDYSRYQWIDQPICEQGVVLASDKDIAAMKINAIEGRGSKKDFIDIYLLLQHYSLAEILNFYKQKYPDFSEYRALRSLVYFEDAEPQEMPTMFIADTWDSMKECIVEAVKQYQK